MPHTAPDALSRDHLRLWLRLLKVSRTIEADLRERFRTEFATTLPRFDVMAALYRARAGLKMSELSGVLRVSNGNVTGIVERLAKDGLLVRVPVPGDRRAALVRLTDHGVATFEIQAAAHATWVSDALATFDSDAARALAAQFETLIRRKD